MHLGLTQVEYVGHIIEVKAMMSPGILGNRGKSAAYRSAASVSDRKWTTETIASESACRIKRRIIFKDTTGVVFDLSRKRENQQKEEAV